MASPSPSSPCLLEQLDDLSGRGNDRVVLRAPGFQRIVRHFGQNCAELVLIPAAAIAEARNLEIVVEPIQPIGQTLACRLIRSLGACDAHRSRKLRVACLGSRPGKTSNCGQQNRIRKTVWQLEYETER